MVASLVASLLFYHLIAFAARSPFPSDAGAGRFSIRGGGAAAASLSFAPWSAWGRLLLAVVGGRRRVRRGRSILFSYLLIGFLYFI